MKLYYAPRTRAGRVRWMLEELKVPYELVTLNLGAGEHRSPEHIARHPLGRVPALEDGDTTFIESAAIVLHLADRFAHKGLAPDPGSLERGSYYQWMLFGAATLEPELAQFASHTRFLPEAERVPAEAERARGRARAALEVLEMNFEDQRPYFLGASFSAADVFIASLLLWARSMGLLEGLEELGQYLDRMTQRPAYQASVR